MTLPAPTYDLELLLDPEADEAMRAKIVADARATIEAQGEFLRHDAWGDRTLSYPIDRKTVAEYHLLQFHAGTPELLGVLDRSLRIADSILRFRIVKLKPGVASAPDVQAISAGGDLPAKPATGAPVQAEPATGEQLPAEPATAVGDPA
jgi:small subunit ribosomal protein S6